MWRRSGRTQSLDGTPAGRSDGLVGPGRVLQQVVGAPRSEKNELKPHLKTYWCIPPKANAEFVAAMEDVLQVYQRPYDATKPLVCLDEASKQLVAQTRKAIPVERGTPKRIDAEYRRCGTASVFMLNAPLEGRRHVRVRERRTRKDFAEVIRELCDELYPDAEKIVLVMDQLNTHNIASLYEAFEPAEGGRPDPPVAEPRRWRFTTHQSTEAG